MSKEKSSFGFGLGLIAGVIGGLIAGILYAPKPGAESRKIVKKTMCELVEKHSPAVSEAKKNAIESVDLFRYKLERQYKKINDKLKSMRMQKAKQLETTDYDFN